MSRLVAVVALVLALVLVNGSIATKEDLLNNGQAAFLELAPLDPRSLMQGDYMALRFRIGTQVYDALPKGKEHRRWRLQAVASDGHVVVKLDGRNIASYKALYHGQPLADDEILMRYRVRNGAVKFATNAFFFQEGHADIYQQARYGQFRVDKEGELLLVAMYDDTLQKLELTTNN